MEDGFVMEKEGPQGEGREVIARLGLLSRRKRAIFAAGCAQRLMDVVRLRDEADLAYLIEALRRIWTLPRESPFSQESYLPDEKEIVSSMKCLERGGPREARWAMEISTLGMWLAMAVHCAFECHVTGTVAAAAEAGSCVVDAVSSGIEREEVEEAFFPELERLLSSGATREVEIDRQRQGLWNLEQHAGELNEAELLKFRAAGRWHGHADPVNAGNDGV